MILALDTATRVVSLALRSDGELIAEHTWRSADHHTTEVAPALDAMLTRAGVAPDDLAAIGVSLGPGSFTGLRIGLSLAKGFVLAAPHIKLIGVATPDIVAEAQPHITEHDHLCVVVQAGRGRISSALYGWQDRWVADKPPVLTTWPDLIPQLNQLTLVAGEIDKAGHEALEAAGGTLQAASPAHSLRRAGYLAEIASRRLAEGREDDPASLAPIYLH